jgi:hypothetical protein
LAIFIIDEQIKPHLVRVAEYVPDPHGAQSITDEDADTGESDGQKTLGPQVSSHQPSKGVRRLTGRRPRASQEAYVRIDLRARVLRGPKQLNHVEGNTVELSPARISFLITLPVGSSKGIYQVSIVDAFGRKLVAGKAISSNGKTLKVSLNLSELPEDKYRLCVSRAREIPDCYQVTVINKR